VITDAQAEKANDFIRDSAAIYANAKASRRYLEEYRKSCKALLFSKSDAKTDKGKESAAYSDDEYLVVLDGLKEAIKIEEELRWKMVAAETKIDMWRTYQANNRRGI